MQTKLTNAEVQLGHRPRTWRIQSIDGAVPACTCETNQNRVGKQEFGVRVDLIEIYDFAERYPDVH